MTKEELKSMAASAAAEVFKTVQGFIPEGFTAKRELSDEESITRFAQIEAGRSYFIAGAHFIEAENEKEKKTSTSKWLDLFETESGAPARAYWGVLSRNPVALTKNGFNGTVGKAREKVGHFLTVTQLERGELKADGSRDIKINYTISENI